MKHYTPEELSEVLRLHQLSALGDNDGNRAYLNGADLREADLNGAYLSGAYLNGAYLNGAYLNGAYLNGADLSGAYLNGADLSGAYLNGADLNGAYLNGAYLNGADLSRADLREADLRGADLRGADLSGAYLSGAYLNGADLNGAYLNRAYGPKLAISYMAVFTGLYKYQCWAVVSSDGVPWVRMGCLWKSVSDWDVIGIRNSNKSEFPDDGSEKCERRVGAFEFTKTEALLMAAKVKGSKNE